MLFCVCKQACIFGNEYYKNFQVGPIYTSAFRFQKNLNLISPFANLSVSSRKIRKNV